MKRLSLLLTFLFVAVLAPYTSAQQPTGQPCSDAPDTGSCAPNLNLTPGQFQASPLIDADCTNGCPDYGDPDHNKVSLYGGYGNAETSGIALAHYTEGTTLAQQIKPLCTDGTENCPLANRRIVFLFLGFSNCDIEICGGNSDAWDGRDHNPNNPNGHLPGQPCATQCPNRENPDISTAWNQVTKHGDDGVTQESLLYQVYHDPLNLLVGQHVVIFDGALGQQTLDRWDPTPFGHYANSNDCQWGADATNAECNYDRVRHDLIYNGFSEKQVQAIFLKSSTSFPQCDLKGLYCAAGAMPDAYLSETYLGNILRYLKCCTLDDNGQSTGIARYPKLKQVFLTSRTYGGYANGTAHGCLSPEPFAYQTVTKL